MKHLFVLTFLLTVIGFSLAQTKKVANTDSKYLVSVQNLTLKACFELQKQATELAAKWDKKVSVAILGIGNTYFNYTWSRSRSSQHRGCPPKSIHIVIN